MPKEYDYSNPIGKMSKVLGSIQSEDSLKIIILALTSEKKIDEISRLIEISPQAIRRRVNVLQSSGVFLKDRSRRNAPVRVSKKFREGIKIIFQALRDMTLANPVRNI
jgi:DNA-binding HxlR family transcriptional regulator